MAVDVARKNYLGYVLLYFIMSSKKAVQNIDDFEVKIDATVSNGIKNEVDTREMKKILSTYKDKLDDERFLERNSKD